MPALTDGFDLLVPWVQVSCHPGNKFCMVMPSIIITGLFSYIQNVDQFTRTEQIVLDSIEVQGSCQNGCSVRSSLTSPTWHQKLRGGS
jgi:hypothetical protein